jgi:hypothetical protein
VYVFAPDNVIVPVPALVNPPVPSITPLSVVLVLSTPAVNTPLPNNVFPAPASDPIVSLYPARLYTAPLATLTALLLDIALLAP